VLDVAIGPVLVSVAVPFEGYGGVAVAGGDVGAVPVPHVDGVLLVLLA
jgi:hypothetical protein